jgi:triosephosphate isomerase
MDIMNTSRVPVIAGNWKMNTTLADAHILAKGVRDGAEHIERIEIVMCPPTVWLSEIADIVKPGAMPHLALGAQNMYFEEMGAFTGETSPLMVKELAEYVIIGHSERVHVFHEKPSLITRKVAAALEHGLTPILCVGEDEQSSTSKTEVAAMLEKIIEEFSPEEKAKIVVAYEPVWAIGTGKAATPEYAQEVMHELRTKLPEETCVLYGGSANDENCGSLLELPDCDGLLIGGASLKLKNFLIMCQTADDLAHKHGHKSKHETHHE